MDDNDKISDSIISRKKDVKRLEVIAFGWNRTFELNI